MRKFVALCALAMICLLPLAADAGNYRYRNNRVHVYLHDADRPRISGGPLHYSVDRYSPCFPFGCGGITAGIKNPAPRAENEKPICYYDASGVLFYEKEGSVCPYKYQDSNALRVERRRRNSPGH